MADVTRDRGQLIMVTGLLIAVAMVALVLLLNTAIYTENLASRGTDQSGREAVEFRATVVEGVGGLIEAENDQEHGSYDPGVETNVEDGIDHIDNRTARRYALGGTVVRINTSSMTLQRGQLIRQTESGAFTNKTTEEDWRLASSVGNTRSFTIVVDDSQLTGTTDSDADDDGAFFVNLVGGSEWQAYVYEDGGEIAVATSDGVGDPEEACSTSESEAVIDLTGGTVNGEPCSGLRWAEGVTGPYDIEYQNGDNATGSYNLTVEGTSADGTHLNSGPPNSPYYVPAVYSVEFDVHYQTSTLTYRATVRVAPGEPS